MKEPSDGADRREGPGGVFTVEGDLPATISLFPELVFAALQAGEEVRLVNHALLRTFDSTNNHGSGWLDRVLARDVLERGRNISRRHAQRQLVDGSGGYWELGPDFVRLLSLVRIAARSGVPRVGRAHRVPLADFQAGLAALRSTMVATSYRTDDRDGPKSRRRVATLTGVSATTQRRYDRQYGHARRVSTLSIRIGQGTEWYVNSFAEMYQDLGFFAGSSGHLMKRHPDIRTAATHEVGSLQAARRVNRALSLGRRPAITARGQRSSRGYFALDRGGVRAWVKDRFARGKSQSGAHRVHPLLNYAVGAQRTNRGRVQLVVLRVPDT